MALLTHLPCTWPSSPTFHAHDPPHPPATLQIAARSSWQVGSGVIGGVHHHTAAAPAAPDTATGSEGEGADPLSSNLSDLIKWLNNGSVATITGEGAGGAGGGGGAACERVPEHTWALWASSHVRNSVLISTIAFGHHLAPSTHMRTHAHPAPPCPADSAPRSSVRMASRQGSLRASVAAHGSGTSSNSGELTSEQRQLLMRLMTKARSSNEQLEAAMATMAGGDCVAGPSVRAEGQGEQVRGERSLPSRFADMLRRSGSGLGGRRSSGWEVAAAAAVNAVGAAVHAVGAGLGAAAHAMGVPLGNGGTGGEAKPPPPTTGGWAEGGPVIALPCSARGVGAEMGSRLPY
jgi:hypothetical protein